MAASFDNFEDDLTPQPSQPSQPTPTPSAPQPASGSGQLIPFDRMTTQPMLSLDRYREMRQSRSLRVAHHEEYARALRADCEDVQRMLFEVAERTTAVYSRWVLLSVVMSPTLDQIADMRALNAQLAQTGSLIGKLRRRYEQEWDQAEQHERAAAALAAHAQQQQHPWGGDAS